MTKRRFLVILAMVGYLLPSAVWAADEKAKPATTPMVGKFAKVNGSVEIQKFGTQTWIQAKEGMAIGSGDQVASGIDGKAQIIFSNSVTDVQPLAQFSVGRNYETKDQYFTEVFLQVGKIKSDVEKNSGKLNKFTVTTPSSVCGIRGTTVESAFVPGVGAINTITDGAGYVAPVQAENLPPAIQQILNVPPSAAAREAAAEAAAKAGAPASVVAQIAAGAAPTEEARAVMAQIAVAGGASPAAAAAIEQGFGSFASIAASLTIEAPVIGADVAPISAPPGAGEPAGAPGIAAPGAEPGAAAGAEPAATGMEAMVTGLAGGAPGEIAGGPEAGPAGDPGIAGNPMEGLAALLATIPGLAPSAAPEAGGGGPAGEPGGPGPGGPAGEPGAPVGEPGAPIGEPGAPVGEPGAPAPVADPFDLGGGGFTGPEIDVADGQSAYSPPPEVIAGGGGGDITPTLFNQPPGDEGGPGGIGLPPEILGQIGPIAGLEPPAPDFLPEIDPNVLEANDPDIDNDGMPNDWEKIYGLNPRDPSDAAADADGDGYPNLAEFGANSRPNDGTDVPSKEELAGVSGAAAFFMTEHFNFDEKMGLDFFDPTAYAPAHDRDGDGINNDLEVQYGLNPDLASDAGEDFDADGFPNIMEILGGSNPADGQSVPSVSDLSYEGLSPIFDYLINEQFNFDVTLGNDFFDPTAYAPAHDRDGDGIPNDQEVTYGLNPDDAADAGQDADGDGFPNIIEFLGGSNPADGQSIPNIANLTYSGLAPQFDFLINEQFNFDATLGGDFFNATSYDPDFDNDGMFNEWEINNGLDPNNPADAALDPDGDGYTNLQEFSGHSDPSNASAVPYSTQAFADDDGDGLPNDWELANGLNPNYPFDAGQDLDGDGVANIDEFFGASDPLNNASLPSSNPDADGDGMPTSWELAFGFDPNNPSDGSLDPDGDGFSTLDEFQYGSNPNDIASLPNTLTFADADGDGLPDNWEIANGLNPNLASDATADPDEDGYVNIAEFNGNSNPNSAASTPTASTGPDQDGDGMPDDYEMFNGFSVTIADAGLDADGDGYTNLQEFQGFSDPLDVNVTPVTTTTTEPPPPPPPPPTTDNDGDGMPNAWELSYGLNPNFADASGDFDGDFVTNYAEFIGGSIPTNNLSTPDASDNDMDGIPNSWEVTYGLNPNDPGDASADADGDGFVNLQESIAGTDPRNPFVLPPHSEGSPTLTMQYDAAYGVQYDVYADGHRTFYNPDKAGTVVAAWAEGAQYHPIHGYGYVNVGSTNFGSDAGSAPTILDSDGDGHSPQAAFIGTVFYDPADANFGSPTPQYSGAQPTPADPFHNTWANNPNPFHH